MLIKSAIIIYLFLGVLWHPSHGLSQEIPSDLFTPSTLVSSEIAHQQIQKIYMRSVRHRTLHCGCVFDKLKQVFPNLCEANSEPPPSKGDPEQLVWLPLMPPESFGKSLKCWNKPVCTRSDGENFKGTQCCSQISPKFKTMESDMHNIFPMIEKPDTAMREDAFSGMWEYSFCSKEEGLREEIRGDASRAYLYMSFQYKIPVEEELENSLRKGHFEDPPDEWEEKRNNLIEVIQGNRNPFIDQPELVERVADF